MALSILALIPARCGSRGLADKNVREVGGVPLLVRAVRLALACRRRSESWRIVVSTDSPRYARLARRAGAEVPFLRPARLSTGRARLIDVVLHAIDALTAGGTPFDVVLLLSATTPLTTVADVRRAVRLFRRSRRAVVSVTSDPVPDAWRFRLRRGRLVATGGTIKVGRRQEGPPLLRMNGAIFMASPSWLKVHRQFFVSGESVPLVMPRDRTLDIEDDRDLRLARSLVSRK